MFKSILMAAALTLAATAASAMSTSSIYIRGDVAAGTGQLVIEGPLEFTVKSNNDASYMELTGLETSGFGSTKWWPEVTLKPTMLSGGTLEISGDTPFGPGSNKFVDRNKNKGNTLFSAPALLTRGDVTRLYFSFDTENQNYQRLRELGPQFNRDVIFASAVFDIPQIDDFVVIDGAADTAILIGDEIVTERLDLTPPAVPLPAGLPLLLAGIGGLGIAGWRREARTR